MTITSTTKISLDDIKAIEFECSECHSRLSVPIKTFGNPPQSCPACSANQQWFAQKSEEFVDVTKLGQILRKLTGSSPTTFSMRLEIATVSSREAV